MEYKGYKIGDEAVYQLGNIPYKGRIIDGSRELRLWVGSDSELSGLAFEGENNMFVYIENAYPYLTRVSC